MFLLKSFLFVAVCVVAAGCSSERIAPVEIQSFAMNSLDGIVAQSIVTFDPAVSADGGGSVRITATGPVTIPLFEVTDPDVENAVLLYQAKLRAENLLGQAYLEMWCHFPGMGEYFSRDLGTPVTTDISWSTEETPFFLKKGENPDRVKLNLVIAGTGTVWIDDIRLVKGPLPGNPS